MGLTAAASGLLLGCPNTGGGNAYTPITGLVFRATSVTAGHGCGEEPDQVYKYAVFVWPSAEAEAGADAGAGTEPACGQDAALMCATAASLPPSADAGITSGPWAGFYDCFADAIFANLPTNDAGYYTYTAALFAFDKPAYDQLVSEGDLSPTQCGPSTLDNASCLAAVTGAATSANWAATCTATQVLGVPAIADCCALATCNAPPDSGLDEGSGDDGAEESGQVADAAADSTLDAPADESDAGADATLDAPSDGVGADATLEAQADGQGADSEADTSLDEGEAADALDDTTADAEGGADAVLDDVADTSTE